MMTLGKASFSINLPNTMRIDAYCVSELDTGELTDPLGCFGAAPHVALGFTGGGVRRVF